MGLRCGSQHYNRPDLSGVDCTEVVVNTGFGELQREALTGQDQAAADGRASVAVATLGSWQERIAEDQMRYILRVGHHAERIRDVAVGGQREVDRVGFKARWNFPLNRLSCRDDANVREVTVDRGWPFHNAG